MCTIKVFIKAGRTENQSAENCKALKGLPNKKGKLLSGRDI